MTAATSDQNKEWRDGFLFIGNQLALDFLNTRLVQDEEPAELLPDFVALLRWFQAAGLLSRRQMADLQRQWGHSARARQAVEALREFRDKLRQVVIAWENGSSIPLRTINELNRLMGRYPMHARLLPTKPSLELYFEPRQPEDLFGPLAHAAATLFADADRTRVRKCAQCVGHFYDTSKKGNRRWCSMQLCGNRQKVAAYAARQRAHRD